MEIFFQDPTDIPLPPEEVRIRQLRAEPWPDGRRVRIYLELTPFLNRPNGEIRLANAQGEEIASLSIIETMDPKMEFTVHLRAAETRGRYLVTAVIFYTDPISTPPAGEAGAAPVSLPEPKIVDRSEFAFEI